MTKYTGVMCVLEMADTPFAIGEVTFDIPRSVVEFQQGGEESNYYVAGGINVTGTIKRPMEDTTLLAKVLGDTTLSGQAGTLHSGLTAPGSGGENVTDMEDTDAKSSRIKLTATSAPITVAGRVVLIGTNVNDALDQETVVIPTLGVNESVTSKKIFKTLTHVASFDYTSTGSLKVESVAGASSIVVGRPEIFNLKSIATKGANNISILAPNCFLTKGSFSHGDANSGLLDDVAFQMQNPKELSLTGVEA